MEKEIGKKMEQEGRVPTGLDGGAGQSEEKNVRETVPTFRKKIGNTTYTVRVHFDQNSEETFEKKVRRLIINDCLQTAENGHFLGNEKFHTTP